MYTAEMVGVKKIVRATKNEVWRHVRMLSQWAAFTHATTDKINLKRKFSQTAMFNHKIHNQHFTEALYNL